MSVNFQWKREVNPDYLNYFLDYRLNVDNFSEQTVYSDNCDIRCFLRFMKCYKILEDVEQYEKISDISDLDLKFIEDLNLADVMQYMNFLIKKKKLSTKTGANRIIAIRLFYRYLYSKLHIIKENQFRNLETPKYTCKTMVAIPLNECEKILDTILETKLEMWERDYAMITIFLNTGMRLSELANASLTKLDMQNKKIVILGKGDKEREIPLNDVCIEALEFYFKVRKGNQANVNNKDYIFLSKRFSKMGKRTIQAIIKKYVELAGLDSKKYTTHKLRHSAATLMLKSGSDLKSIQSILGHEHISTTERYLHIDDDDLKKAVNNNPLNHRRLKAM